MISAVMRSLKAGILETAYGMLPDFFGIRSALIKRVCGDCGIRELSRAAARLSTDYSCCGKDPLYGMTAAQKLIARKCFLAPSEEAGKWYRIRLTDAPKGAPVILESQKEGNKLRDPCTGLVWKQLGGKLVLENGMGPGYIIGDMRPLSRHLFVFLHITVRARQQRDFFSTGIIEVRAGQRAYNDALHRMKSWM